MAKQYQCRLCSASYEGALGFLDHYETHMTKQNTFQKEQNSKYCDDQQNEENEEIEKHLKGI